MSADRNPDRIVRAWLELMPDEAPDRTIAAVRQAVETTSQVRRPLVGRWRLPTMNRLALAGAASLIAVAAVFVALGSRPQNGVGSPTPSPTASATPSPSIAASPSATPLVSGLGSGMGYATTAPDFLRSATWVADAGTIPGLTAAEPRIRLKVSPDGNLVSVVETAAGLTTLNSQPVSGGASELSLVATSAASGCAVGDFGHYQIHQSTDGLTMTLTAVADACQLRSATLARTWARAVDGASAGGTGVVTHFQPMFTVTLPKGSYVGDPGIDSAGISDAGTDRTLIAVRNPVGFTAPCSTDGGTRRPLVSTIAAFAAYLGTLPGFTIQSNALQIDGRAALHLTIPSKATANCATGRVVEWTAANSAEQGNWHLAQGDTDVVYLVQVGTDVYLLQWLGNSVTSQEELNVLSTVHFIDTLPIAP
jgi:hypothetical protein